MPPRVKLYVLPGSHPALTAMLCLERKGIPFERKDLLPAVHTAWLRVAGFPGSTVPAMAIDGRKVQGSREIARELDRVQPEPPLYPADPERRAAVEEAERWGDWELQAAARRLAWGAMKRDRSALADIAAGARFGVPTRVALAGAPLVVPLSAWKNGSTDERLQQDLAALPAWLDHVDELIARGVLGTGEPTAADFQIGTSLRLLMGFDDLAPFIAGRPAGDLAERLVPPFPARIAPVFPPEWLSPLRAAAEAAAPPAPPAGPGAG